VYNSLSFLLFLLHFSDRNSVCELKYGGECVLLAAFPFSSSSALNADEEIVELIPKPDNLVVLAVRYSQIFSDCLEPEEKSRQILLDLGGPSLNFERTHFSSPFTWHLSYVLIITYSTDLSSPKDIIKNLPSKTGLAAKFCKETRPR